MEEEVTRVEDQGMGTGKGSTKKEREVYAGAALVVPSYM